MTVGRKLKYFKFNVNETSTDEVLKKIIRIAMEFRRLNFTNRGVKTNTMALIVLFSMLLISCTPARSISKDLFLKHRKFPRRAIMPYAYLFD